MASSSRVCPRALRALASRPAIQAHRTQLYHQLLSANRPTRPLRPTHYLKHAWPQSRRHASTRVAAKKLFKEYPFSVSLAGATILFGFGMLIYVNHIYRTYIIGDFAAYPEPVAAKLRRALYYTNISLHPSNALKYYRQALSLADELGMDPFSDEIMGVKIQLSALFEKCNMYGKAIEVLEIVRRDNLRWMEELGGLERNVESGKRTRVLGKTIAVSVRLGEWYAREEVGDREAAEERLVWAVTTLLKEQKRREDEGVREGEGEWMSDEEIGGALESLATHYTSLSNHYLAAPLYLHALSLCPPKSCHTVVLLNNLAISLASQASEQIPSARTYAHRALSLASTIAPPARTRECDEGCAVATINLGDFASMEGDVGEARRRWEEGRGLCRGIGFAEGEGRCVESLKELQAIGSG